MIMIVDDNRHMRAIIKRYVQHIDAGEEYCECDNGLAAVEAYAKVRPGHVFMDLKMEGMDGLTATVKILELFPDANIIIVTDFEDQLLVDEAHRAGAKGYVTKDRLWELRKYIAKSGDSSPRVYQ